MSDGRGITRNHPLTLMDHVRELRTRLFIVAAAFIVGSSLAYIFRDPLIHLLLSPLKGQKLVYLNVAGGFNFIFLISIYTGFAVAVPLLIQQLYQFLQPILPKKVQRYSARIFISSFILLCAGAVFGYIFAIPGALKFLYSFADNYVVSSLTADSYLSFVIAYTIGLGLVFQLPLVLLFIHWIKPLEPGGLLKSERWVILLAFILAAILTPTTDPINQTIIALPIILVYQIGVIAVLVSISSANKRRALATAPISEPARAVSSQPVVTTDPPRAVVTTIHAQRPSLDGIVHHPSKSRTALRVPPRQLPTSAISPSPRPRPIHQPRLAIDGISPLFP